VFYSQINNIFVSLIRDKKLTTDIEIKMNSQAIKKDFLKYDYKSKF